MAASGAAALVLTAAGGALAHVTVHSADAKPGGSDATVVFKVPNEESNASTTKVEIDLPADTPLTGVTATAPSGWKADVSSTQIVFSGGSITGDNDQEFPITVGTLPTADKIVFKALQTYSNGDVVRWIEQSADGAPEPAHPAPTLDLHNPNAVDKDNGDDHAASGSSGGSTSGMGTSGMDMGTMSMASTGDAATAAPSSSGSSMSSSSGTSSPSPSSSSSSSSS
ncbi:MAG TPA: YcnI family protein, partial [Sporichthyaceae bacterium]|nr:YcnI family protein [Sporichthyaceae bacterium]